PARYREHWKKAERADTAYPVHVARHRGRWVILDGYHRLLKTLARGGRTVRVVKVTAGDLSPRSGDHRPRQAARRGVDGVELPRRPMTPARRPKASESSIR